MKPDFLLSHTGWFSSALVALALWAAPAGAVREERGTNWQRQAFPALPPSVVRSVTPLQLTLADQAAQVKCVVQWDNQLGVPCSVRGTDLGRRGTFSRGKGLAVGGQGLYERDAVAVMDGLAGLFRITDAEQDFRARSVQTDRLGFHHVRLQQMSGGVKVQGGEIIVHFDKNNLAYEVNGRYLPEIQIPLAPALLASDAVLKAQSDLIAQRLPAGTLSGTPELVVFTRRDPALLAYAVTLVYRDKSCGPGRWRYWVDARTGVILDCYNDIQHISPPTTDGIHCAINGSVLDGEGGGATNITGWYDNLNTNYYLSNTNFHWIVKNVAAEGYSDSGTYAFRPTNNWGTSDRSEISIAAGLDLTQRYFKQVHGRNSFDGTGGIARANVHEGDAYVNAYWDGSELYFGDGDGVEANSLAVLDVSGHEFSHAVTDYSANLIYHGESGALNESFSDIFGSCIEFFGQADGSASYPVCHAGQADWLCGEDSWLTSTALRDIRNPSNAATVGDGQEQPSRYHGTYWYYGSGDNAGVHYNSGVQNHFFYLLCEGGSGNNDGINYSVPGIGITNAGQVAYRALTVYCTPETDYHAVRSAWLSAAMDLSPSWAGSVSAAWDAVGVQAFSITPLSGASFYGSEGHPVSPSNFVFTISNDGDNVMGWGASHTQAWVTVAPPCGAMPALGSQTVTVTVNSAALELSSGTYADTVVFTNSSSAASDSRSVALLVWPPVVYAFNLDADPGWTTEGQWAFGVPQGLEGDPASGFTGSNVYGYNLAGAYSNDMPVYALTTPAIDCSRYTNLSISFRRWLGVERAFYDHASVQVSTNDTAWVTVWENTDVSVQDTDWQLVNHDISAVADRQPAVYLRWLMGPTDYSVTFSGWNIDDIEFNGCTLKGQIEGVMPSSGSYTGGYQVVVTGTNLCNGTMGDVTSVQLCGVTATIHSVQSSTQIVVVAGTCNAALLGDVRVISTRFGETLKTNAFAYLRLDAPEQLDPVDITASNLVVRWRVVPAASTHKLDVGLDTNFTTYLPGYHTNDVALANQYPVTGLSNSIWYAIRLFAWNSNGYSLPSRTAWVPAGANTPYEEHVPLPGPVSTGAVTRFVLTNMFYGTGLSYTVESSDTNVVSVSIIGGQLEINPHIPGAATITMHASNSSIGYTSSYSFLVTVCGPPTLVGSAFMSRELWNPRYTQVLRVCNNSATDAIGIRVLFTNLYPGITVENRTGTAWDGRPMIEMSTAFPVGSTQDLSIVYLCTGAYSVVSNPPAIELQYILPGWNPLLPGGGALVLKIVSMPDDSGRIVLEFESVAGQSYAIEYMNNFPTNGIWVQVPLRLRAGANRTQWIDAGPPATQPRAGMRAYQVRQLVE